MSCLMTLYTHKCHVLFLCYTHKNIIRKNCKQFPKCHVYTQTVCYVKLGCVQVIYAFAFLHPLLFCIPLIEHAILLPLISPSQFQPLSLSFFSVCLLSKNELVTMNVMLFAKKNKSLQHLSYVFQVWTYFGLELVLIRSDCQQTYTDVFGLQ